jgi:hypothetical protein
MENFRVDMKIIVGSSLCNYLLISISQNKTHKKLSPGLTDPKLD